METGHRYVFKDSKALIYSGDPSREPQEETKYTVGFQHDRIIVGEVREDAEARTRDFVAKVYDLRTRREEPDAKKTCYPNTLPEDWRPSANERNMVFLKITQKSHEQIEEDGKFF
jgi:hypothetical protein